MSAENSSAYWSMRRRWAAALGGVVLATTVITGTPRSPAAGDAPLPGRIYIVDTFLRDVLNGLLAIDPNERVVMSVEKTIRGAARIAPDGHKVAYINRDPDSGFFVPYTLDLDKNQDPVRVGERMGTLTWSGDGKALILSLLQSDDPNQPTNWRMNADGSGRRPLAVPSTEHIWDCSTDGQWLIAGSTRRGGNVEPPPALQALPHFVLRIDGTDAREIVPAGVVAQPEAGKPTIVSLSPRFSPDGWSVCYIRSSYEGAPSATTKFTSALWTVGRDGANPRRLFEGTDDEGHPRSVAWSPDGKALALGLVKPKGDRRDGSGTIPRLLIINTGGATLREIPLPAISYLHVADWR